MKSLCYSCKDEGILTSCTNNWNYSQGVEPLCNELLVFPMFSGKGLPPIHKHGILAKEKGIIITLRKDQF
jgi:hypothetical protein